MADLNLGTYSPEDVAIVITVPNYPPHIVTGTAAGTFVKVTRAIESSKLYQGADKSGGRVFHSNNAGMIELTLSQLSSTSDYLSQIYKNDSEARDSTWLFDILIRDNTGRSFYDASQCFISQIPESDFGDDVSNRTWNLHSINLIQHIGGNAKIDPATVQAITAIGGDIDPKWIGN